MVGFTIEYRSRPASFQAKALAAQRTRLEVMMPRLFVGVRLSRSIRQMLLDRMDGIAGARWQTDAQLHLTLRFLGEIDPVKAGEIAAILRTVDRAGATLALRGVGSFHRQGIVHTLWAGVAPDHGLMTLRARVVRALARLGVAPDPQAFLPHITLARLGRGAAPVVPFIRRNGDLVSSPQPIDAFTLFESVLTPDGANYFVVERYPLDCT